MMSGVLEGCVYDNFDPHKLLFLNLSKKYMSFDLE